MAENHPPLNPGASLKSCTLPPANPMHSDRLYNVTQLISPPPEDTLRRTAMPSLLASTPQSFSKRKRRTQPTVSLHQELTPNPKPRKHAKQVTDPESPTRSTFARSTIPIKSRSATPPYCGNPFRDSDDLDYYDWRSNTRPDDLNSSDSLSMIGFRPSEADIAPVELPIFHLDDLPPSSDAWSDSDDDVLDGLESRQDAIEEGEGQYTGRWRTLLVKTKQDPPSSATRARMEHWGRPVSPFPEEAKSFQLLDDEEEQVQDGLGLDKLEEAADQDEQDEIDEEEVRRISVEPEDEDDVPMQTTRIGHPEPGVVPMNNLLPDDASDDDCDDETELSFVKITSADPRAAARAAAILKQHDYDCFTEITNPKRRRSPDRMLRRGTTIAEALARKGIADGRITKGKTKKRSSVVGTGVIGSQVFISGAPVTTLQNLLEEVESEVSFIGTPTKGGRETPLSRRPSLGTFDCSFINCLTSREGESEWTKYDWKLLDACFTDERLVVGRRLQLEGDGLVDVDAINIDYVVDRYIGILGGEDSVKRLGMDWERDVIVQRAKALRKKQRSGNVAPPTTPMSTTVNRTPDVDIPDFTPLQGRTLNCHPPTTPATFGARVKGFLSSCFPTLSRTAPLPSGKTLNTVQPRLPLPPPDLLDKPRAPITTPARPSLPKPKHPKELVQLHPAPLPKVSLIPRLKPRRLVQLNPVPPPMAREPIPVLKPRNSSGSVKDLVQSFEELKKGNEGEKTSKKST